MPAAGGHRPPLQRMAQRAVPTFNSIFYQFVFLFDFPNKKPTGLWWVIWSRVISERFVSGANLSAHRGATQQQQAALNGRPLLNRDGDA